MIILVLFFSLSQFYHMVICGTLLLCWQSVILKIMKILSDLWLVGDSYLYWAEKRAALRGISDSFGLSQISGTLWLTKRGMSWKELMPRLQYEVIHNQVPKVLVIHLGANDLCNVGGATLQHMIRNDLKHIISLMPRCKLIFSSLVQRRSWRGATNVSAIEEKRVHTNRRIRTFLNYEHRGYFVCHKDIESAEEHFYRGDGVHLTDISTDLFLFNIKDAVKTALGF